MGKFVISTRKNGEFQFNLKAGNGQIILSSEGYKTKASCENGIASVKNNAVDVKPERVDGARQNQIDKEKYEACIDARQVFFDEAK